MPAQSLDGSGTQQQVCLWHHMTARTGHCEHTGVPYHHTTVLGTAGMQTGVVLPPHIIARIG